MTKQLNLKSPTHLKTVFEKKRMLNKIFHRPHALLIEIRSRFALPKLKNARISSRISQIL